MAAAFLTALGAFNTVALTQESAVPTAPAEPAPAATTDIVIHTTIGDIEIALETTRAPITTGNFLRYVDAKRFDDTSIYRAVKIGDDGKYGLVQGGLRGDRKRAFPAIAHESPAITGLSHRDGAISMAREAPGSATGDFFFIVGDLVSLDGKPDADPGYAVFGRVTSGLDIVRSILDLPRSEIAEQEVMKGQMLAEPVKITSVRRSP